MSKKIYIGTEGDPITLPDGYTQVEYLENTGTQYINTGIIGQASITVMLDFEILSGDLTDFIPIGCAPASYSPRFYPVAVQSHLFAYGFSNWQNSTTSAILNKRYAVETDLTAGAQKMKVNNVIVKSSSDATAVNVNLNMFLFGANIGGTYRSYGNMKVYGCKIYNAGLLIRDFIPCINSNGIGGLYDLVNNIFHTNAGTGVFLTGTATVRDTGVAKEVKGIYIGVNDLAKRVIKGYIGVNGIAKEFYSYYHKVKIYLKRDDSDVDGTEAKVTINGVTYCKKSGNLGTTIYVLPGTVATFTLTTDYNPGHNNVYLNDTLIAEAPANTNLTYQYTITSDTEIGLWYQITISGADYTTELIDGRAYIYADVPYYTLNITGSGTRYDNTVTSVYTNDTTYTGPATIKLPIGTAIYCNVYGEYDVRDRCKIILNGTTIATGHYASYKFVLDSNTQITLASYDWDATEDEYYGTITITTS